MAQDNLQQQIDNHYAQYLLNQQNLLSMSQFERFKLQYGDQEYGSLNQHETIINGQIQKVRKPQLNTGIDKSIVNNHVRQISQAKAEKLKKDMLLSSQLKQKPTSNKGTFSQTQGRTLNQKDNQGSPIMQPPPQILQKHIIINLYRTDYPILEEVARDFMHWRISKQANPSSEFDLFW